MQSQREKRINRGRTLGEIDGDEGVIAKIVALLMV